MANENFIDYVKLYLKSGKGGAGSAHFFRAKGLPKGGPDGGNGGKGGSIIIKANPQLWTLLHLKYSKHLSAVDGGHGAESNMTGADGASKIIEVPVGTSIKDGETGDFIGEVTEPGQEFELLPGGRGGKGNLFFTTSTNRAPTKAQPGEPGQEGWFILELKLLADVGLVGYPNAGKSTLLSVVSEAKPKIADYPFTTLVPNLGVVKYRDYKSFVMADIPGIIEGASEGKGLGLRFLRHIERNSILLFVIPADSEDPIREFKVLRNELSTFNPELISKRFVVAFSKADLVDEARKTELEKLKIGAKSIVISSATRSGIQELKDLLWTALQEANL